MHFHNFEFDDEKFLTKLNKLISKKGIFFLDTNILLWIHRLTLDSQNLIVDKLEELGNEERLFIPKWVISEYNDKCIDPQKDSAFYPFKQLVNQPSSTLKELKKYASLFIDDENLKSSVFSCKDEYLSLFDELISNAEKISKPFKNSADFPTKLDSHKLITKKLGHYVLDTNLDHILSKVNSNAELRYKHRIPPGYKDSSKGENTYGDLIIWYEILEKSKQYQDKENDCMVFLTNDNKPDWAYRPDKTIKRDNLVIKNKHSYQARSELKSEMKSYSNKDFFLLNMSDLVQGLSIIDHVKYKPLAQGLQLSLSHRDDKSDSTSKNESRKEDPETENNNVSETIQTIDSNDLIDEIEDTCQNNHTLDLSSILNGEISNSSLMENIKSQSLISIIEGVKSYNWSTQTLAFKDALQYISDFRLTNSNSIEFVNFTFILGKYLYKSASGNCLYAQELLDISDKSLLDIKPEYLEIILLGSFVSIIFDSNADIRESLLTDYTRKLFKIIYKTDLLEPLFKKLYSSIESLGYESVLFSIESDIHSYSIEIDILEHEIYPGINTIEDLKINGHSIICQSSHGFEDDLNFKLTEYGTVNHMDYQTLVMLNKRQLVNFLEDQYLVPSKLSYDYIEDGDYTLSHNNAIEKYPNYHDWMTIPHMIFRL